MLIRCKCLSQIFQGVNSRDGPEAGSWFPLCHTGPVLTGECQHHELRTGGLQTLEYSDFWSICATIM